MVIEQHANKEHDYVDQILEKESEINSEKVCELCGCEADITYRVCRNCNGKVTKQKMDSAMLNTEINIDQYGSFHDFKNSLSNITCTVGEPDFINPNSYSAIIQVIQNIGVRAGIKQYGTGSREWLFIECDVFPYNTIRSIIANIW